MTTKQTEAMTDIQAFRRRFESLDGWGIRINGLDGRLVEIDEYDDDCELSTQGHFTYVSHDADGVTVEVGLPDRDPYKDVVIPFAADGDEVERLLMGAIRECEKAEEALATPETPAAPKPAEQQEPEWVAEIRKTNAQRRAANEARLEAERKAEYEKELSILKQRLADFGLKSTNFIEDTDGSPIAEIDGVYFGAAGAFYLWVGLPCPDLHDADPKSYGLRMWRKAGDRSEIPGALDSIRYDISTARARINRPVTPPTPKVEVEMIAIHEGGCGIPEGVSRMKSLAAEGYKVAGFSDGWAIMQRVNEEN